MKKTNYLFFSFVIAVSGCGRYTYVGEKDSASDYRKSFELVTGEELTFFVIENVYSTIVDTYSGEKKYKSDKTFGIYAKGHKTKYCLTANESGVNDFTSNFRKPFFCDDTDIKELNYEKYNPYFDQSKDGKRFKIFIGERHTLLIEADRSHDKWRYKIRSIPTDIQHIANAVNSNNLYQIDGYIAKRIASAQNIFDEIHSWPDLVKSRAVARPQNIAESIKKRLSDMSDDEIKSGTKKIAKEYERILHADGFFGVWYDRFRTQIDKNPEKAKSYLLLMQEYVNDVAKRKIFEESLISLTKPENIWEVKNCRKISQHDEIKDTWGFLGLSRTGSMTKRNVILSCIVDIRDDAIYKPSYKYKLRGSGRIDFIRVVDGKEEKEGSEYASDFVLWEGKPVSITFNIDLLLSRSSRSAGFTFNGDLRLKSYNVYTPLIKEARVN